MFLVLKLFLVTVHTKIEDTDAIKAGDSNNSFFDHLLKNPSHEIDWEKVSYFDKKRNTDRLKNLYISEFLTKGTL